MDEPISRDHESSAETGDWCLQRDWVPDGNRIYRCSVCRKRLHPREMHDDGEFKGWQLPPHKKKGHKIRAARMRRQRHAKGVKRGR